MVYLRQGFGLNHTLPVDFVIADGVVAMEGNGPLQGAPGRLGKVVLADDPVAADATCARLMGLEPLRIPYLEESAKFLGNSGTALIEQLGETLVRPQVPFQVVPQWAHLLD
jgi:uncharacterized protein (DUF362 family)